MSQYVVPAAQGILAYVKINSMGGEFYEIRQGYSTWCCQMVIYFILAMLVYKRNINKYKIIKPVTNEETDILSSNSIADVNSMPW